MIAYNTSWLDNLFVQQELDKARRKGCVGSEETQAIKARYPVGFYSPNMFIRIGFFVLTAVIALFTFGLLTLILMSVLNREQGWSMLSIFCGVLAYVALELLVNGRKLYRAGADDALLWISGAFIITGICTLVNVGTTGGVLLIFLLSGFLCLRFVNAVMGAIATISFLAVVFLLYIKLGAWARASAPFLMILLCAGLYLLLQKARAGQRWKRYAHCIDLSIIVALVCLYLCGNFYAVQQLSNSMFVLHLRGGEGIAGSWFFWLWTLLIPPLYIFRGLQKKDTVLLRTGLLLVGMLVFTVRYSYHLMPGETVMVIGGVLLTGIAWALMRYLKTPRHGFTHEPASDPHMMDQLNVEALVIAETFKPAPPAGPSSDPFFGGGSGSGGGASGTY